MSIKRLFLLIDLILIALAVYLGVKGVYAFVASRLDTLPPETADRSIAISTSASTDLPPFSDFRAIAQRNLFHTNTATEKASTNLLLDNLEKTQLKLKLLGTAPVFSTASDSTTAAGDPEKSYAIIEDENKREQHVYKVNDTVQENATLKMILSDRVVLSVSGKDEVLKLEKRSESGATAARSRTASVSALASTTGTRTSPTVRISLSRTQVDSAMENLTELMGQVTIQPYSEEGLEGLSLSNIKPNSIFRRMGLRNGDVLVAVDGQALTSVDQAYKLYEDLKSSDTANVQISRRGRSRTIEYRIR